MPAVHPARTYGGDRGPHLPLQLLLVALRIAILAIIIAALVSWVMHDAGGEIRPQTSAEC